jgi:hypothetical protein
LDALRTVIGVGHAWNQGLEGWNVRVSQQVLEWQTEAKVETQRANIIRALVKRCKAPVPGDLAQAIQANESMSVLLRWFDAALEAGTFDEFRTATQAGH